EAALMSPEQRVLLECTDEALQASGYGQRSGALRAGVFVAAGRSAYPSCSVTATGQPINDESGIAGLIVKASPATRPSSRLNLSGPSVTVDTACSSSLVAVHMGCRALLAGECEMALVGGVSSLNPGMQGIGIESGGMRSITGYCRPFDDDADGTVFTSGVGI